MNCFNHRDKPAIGLCRSCLKALCEDCLAELTDGLACKGVCGARVNMINRTLDSNAQIVDAARRQNRGAGIFTTLFGIAFAVFGVWAYFGQSGFLACLLGAFAAVMIVAGVVRLSRKQQYPKLDEGTGTG
jgi:hypothetical protein